MNKRLDYLEFLNSELDNAYYIASDSTQEEKERQEAIKYMRQLTDDIQLINQLLKRYEFDTMYFVKENE